MHFRIPRNFRLRTRIYPRVYGDGYRYYMWDSSNINSNISSVDQNITNFGTQTDVTQSSVVNQSIIDRVK